MRALGVLLAGLMVGVGSAPVLAATEPAEPPAPVEVCLTSDRRLGELSGLVADGERWYAVNDGGTKSTVYVLTLLSLIHI